MVDSEQTNLAATGATFPKEDETPKPPETKVYTEADYKALVAEKEKVEKQMSGLHKELSKRDLKLKEAQELHTRLDSMELGLATLFDKLDAKATNEFETEEKPPVKGETYQQAQQRKQQEREAQRQANQFTEEATEAGLTADETKAIMFSTRSYEEGRLKLKEKLMEKETSKVKETETETKKKFDETVEAEVRKRLTASGAIKVETGGTPAGGGGGLTPEIVKKMSPEERFNRSGEIAKMPLGLKSLK